MQNRTLIYSFLESDYFITFYHFKTGDHDSCSPFRSQPIFAKKSANPETWSAYCLLVSSAQQVGNRSNQNRVLSSN